jgi:hypothetical protein
MRSTRGGKVERAKCGIAVDDENKKRMIVISVVRMLERSSR